MKTIREPDWRCWKCGHAMNAATDAFGDATPSENDISVCINCGALFSRHGSAWEPMTTIEINSLKPKERAMVDKARANRRRIVKDR